MLINLQITFNTTMPKGDAMPRKDTITMKMTKNGNEYQIEERKYEQMEALLIHANDSMTSPCIFHLCSHIDKPDLFKLSKRDLIKNFERALKRQYKPLKQDCPKVFVIYSIEFKNTSQKEIDGDDDAYDYATYRLQEKLPFLHMHFYVIADCSKTIPSSFPNYARCALNEIDGLRASRYFKSNKTDKVEIYKKLKSDIDDAFDRILYIGKIEQKTPDIPFHKKFGISKVA